MAPWAPPHSPYRTVRWGRSSKRLLSLRSDDLLVARIRAGDDAAFEVLYERHLPGILSFSRHMLGSREEAEDAVQATFISAHRDLLGGEREIKLKPWLYTIARNRCLSILRARREQAGATAEGATAGLHEQVQRRSDLRELVADLHELPDDQRAVLVLTELRDLSHAEVAEVLGCEAGKVKGLVFRARSNLLERREAREASCEDIRWVLREWPVATSSVMSGRATRRRRQRQTMRPAHRGPRPQTPRKRPEVHSTVRVPRQRLAGGKGRPSAATRAGAEMAARVLVGAWGRAAPARAERAQQAGKPTAAVAASSEGEVRGASQVHVLAAPSGPNGEFARGAAPRGAIAPPRRRRRPLGAGTLPPRRRFHLPARCGALLARRVRRPVSVPRRRPMVAVGPPSDGGAGRLKI